MKKYKRVYIEITNICNLKCSFCPLNSREKKFISKEQFEHVIREIKPYTEYIYMHLMGEPLLHPQLKELLEIAYNNEIKVNITTNGTLLSKVKDIIMNSKSVRQVNISLHSFEANSGVDFDGYVKNVLEFIKEVNENTDIICSMRLWNLDSYKLKGENKLNSNIFEKIKDEFNYEGDLRAIIERERKVKISKNIYLNSAEKFQWPTLSIDVLDNNGFCHGLRDHFGILVDGTVVPCCLDGEGVVKLGNIYSQKLDDILNSERAMSIYNGFSQRKRVEDLCKRCGYSEIFKK